MTPKKDIELVRKFANMIVNNPILEKFWPNPKGFPEVVYKYRCWHDENHRRMLENNEIYMSPAKFFNDPFDCKLYKNYYLLDTPEKIKNHIDKSMHKYAEWMKENKKNPEEMRKIIEERTSDIIMYQVRGEYYDNIMNNQNYGTACFSKHWDSILMWSHYANNHKGFCLGFDRKKLEISGLFGKGDYVDYIEEFPIIHPDEEEDKTQSLRTYRKHKLWDYEGEYRLMNIFPGEGADEKSEKRKIRVPLDFIIEILLGVDITDQDKEAIIKIANERKILVYEVVKVPFKFELERFRID